MRQTLREIGEHYGSVEAYLDFIVKLKKTASGGAAAQPTPASTANQKTSDALARILRRGS